MKEQIKKEDINRLKRDNTIFTILLICEILLAVPLIVLMENVGVTILLLIVLSTGFYAYRVEEFKKKFNLKTFKEAYALLKGKSLD